jgi:hypothetical protein
MRMYKDYQIHLNMRNYKIQFAFFALRKIISSRKLKLKNKERFKNNFGTELCFYIFSCISSITLYFNQLLNLLIHCNPYFLAKEFNLITKELLLDSLKMLKWLSSRLHLALCISHYYKISPCVRKNVEHRQVPISQQSFFHFSLISSKKST